MIFHYFKNVSQCNLVFFKHVNIVRFRLGRHLHFPTKNKQDSNLLCFFTFYLIFHKVDAVKQKIGYPDYLSNQTRLNDDYKHVRIQDRRFSV